MLALSAGVCDAYSAGDPEFRAIFVSAWSVGCRNAAEIDQLVADAHACNANTIVAQMRRRGDTFYPSPYEPWATGITPGFDALAYLVQKCHSTSPRLDVQAWFVVWPIASDGALPGNPNHPYNKYPQYLTKNDGGSTNIAGEYWFDPGNPNAEQYTYNVVMDVVNRYDVDGINLDYIRYAYNNMGYNDVSVARFNAAYGRSGQPISTDYAWCAWRRDQVTNFVRKCYANAIALKPGIKVTADVFCSTPAATSDANWPSAPAYCNYFQDWRAWMEEGIIDLSNPMSYFSCTGTYEHHFGYWTCFARDHQYGRQAAMTISITGKGTDCAIRQMLEARNTSCPGTLPAAGMGIYSYSSIDTSMLNAIRSVWSAPAAVPSMPWKTAPTKGHMMGNVTFAGVTWIDRPTLSITGPTSRTMFGDGTGFFAFIDLPPGSYTVTCTSPTYGVLSKACSVSAGAVSSANFDYPLSTLTISNVQASGETGDTATVTWDTNGPASSKVYYGTDRNCSLSTAENGSQVTSHSVTLTGLAPMTTYYYRVYSKNPSAAAAMSDARALVTTVTQPIITIDNPAASYSGSWATASSSSDRYGADYLYASVSTTVKTVTFTPNIPVAGTYNVYEWHPQGTNRVTAAPVTVNYSGGSQTYYVNQQSGGGAFNLIATKPFAAGTSGSVVISNQGSGGTNVMADAVQLRSVAETTPPSNPVGLHTVGVQDDFINLTWMASTDNVGVAGYRVTRGGAVIDVSPTNSYADSDVASNTRYSYSVSAFDTSGNKSANSSTLTVCTLPVLPTFETVACDRAAGVWQTAGPFTFAAVGGFGVGKVNFYRYAWDTSPTHTWTGAETPWSSGTIACPAASSANGYYLHIKGYNQDNKPGDPADLGPYYIDSTPPAAPMVTDEGGYSPLQTTVHASWSCDDQESGIIGYQYAVGTNQGAIDLVNWTPTTDTSATITIPSQDVGAMVYVSVKARNGSKLWSDAGNSDGIRIARAIASVSDAKKLADDGVLFIGGRIVTGVFSGSFYVEDPDRVSGIRVEGSCPLPVGTRVDVGGVLSRNAANERVLNTGSVAVSLP